MSTHEPQDWYDWTFPLNRKIAKDWDRSTLLGRAWLVVASPFAAWITILWWGFLGIMLFAYPIMAAGGKLDTWLERLNKRIDPYIHKR